MEDTAPGEEPGGRDPVLDRTDPLNEADAAEQPLLEALQGNILRGHGRDHAAHVFFSFEGPIAQVRSALKRLAHRYVTSALRQYRETERYKRENIPGGTFGNLFLTRFGYQKLGYDPVSLFGRDEDPRTPEEVRSNFADGMRAHAAHDFRDPPPDTWDPGFRRDIDAMFLVADDDPHAVVRTVQRVAALLQRNGCAIRGVERGEVVRNANGQGIEHFGFVDGRSQPLYLASDFDHPTARHTDARGERLGVWDPFEPLRRVLIRDPVMKEQALPCFGSFLVFRKFEQDVRGFRTELMRLAMRLGLEGEASARAGAMVMGRFEDGTPIVMQKEGGWHPSMPNNFNYDTDIAGGRCPLHAHIRKVNPRGRGIKKEDPPDTQRIRRITRRSITYGDHVPVTRALDALPSGDVGVLFMCFQSSIRAQFAFMQSQWCNERRFPRAYTGIDPLVGQAGSAADREYLWPGGYNHDPSAPGSFAPFVRMKGGEFFFAPSRPFFAQL